MSSAALSVSDVTGIVAGALASRPELEDVLVEGELSNIGTPVSGHLYFTLKDKRASLQCVCFRANALRIPFRPEHGMTVVAHGSVQVYEAQGQYQLYVDRLEPSGVGALALAVEQLKRRLSAEGLFDERIKRRLPLLPRRVVVVTSRSGAAFRDVHTVLTRRAPGVDIVLSPATVQGDGAAETIVRALRRAEGVARADVILLVRGGGSIEDLMAFNSEAVARAIRSSRLPVVTGVGHETDTTIADLAADRRGPTPSAAAELVVPNVTELRRDVAARRLRCMQAVQRRLQGERNGVERRRARVERLSPSLRVATLRQDLDRRSALLRHALLREVALQRRRLDAARGSMRGLHPEHRLAAYRARIERTREQLAVAGGRVVASRRAALAPRVARIEALSPRRVLERGYSITLDASGGVITDAATVAAGDRLETLLHRGRVLSTVETADVRDARDEQMYDAGHDHDGRAR